MRTQRRDCYRKAETHGEMRMTARDCSGGPNDLLRHDHQSNTCPQGGPNVSSVQGHGGHRTRLVCAAAAIRERHRGASKVTHRSAAEEATLWLTEQQLIELTRGVAPGSAAVRVTASSCHQQPCVWAKVCACVRTCVRAWTMIASERAS